MFPELTLAPWAAIGEQGRAEPAMHESEELFRLVFEHSPDAILLIDPHDPSGAWPIVACNATACSMNGYTRQELIGQSVQLLNLDPEENSTPDEYLAELQRVSSIKAEVTHRRKDGTRFPIETSTSLVMIGGRELILGIDRDISERVRIERALRESEDRKAAIIQSALDCIVTIDHTGSVIEFNPAAEQTFGYSRDAVLGQELAALIIPPALREAHRQGMARYMATGVGPVLGKRVEVSAMRADGTQFPVELAITRIAGDGPPLFTAYLRDITERKRAEEVLEQEHQQLRQVIDTVPVAIAMFDTEMRYLAYSQKWLVDNDLAGQTLIGRSHYEVVPGLPERLRETHRRALAGETLAQSEDPILNARGEMHYWRWALTPWYSTSGDVGGVILASDLVDDLVRGREAALEASRLKSEFLATMSHEIRTPMNGILGMTELLMQTALTAEQQDYAGVVRDSSQALLTLLHDILDLSKIEAGKMLLDREDFAPRLLAEGAGNLLVAKAREKRIRLLTDVAPQAPARLRGDSGRLRQVLLNLLGNAVKFTETGEVSLCITVETETSAQVALRFAITDSGIGLSERARGYLFQPFMQADGSTTRKYGGTGLGLAISKQLVELMGGTIGVDSVEGQGSTFWFIVPFERADDLDGEPPALPDLWRPLPVQHAGDQGRGTSVLPPPSRNSDRIILVAEDNPVNQKLALLQLRKLGYQAEAVANGREAVGAVARGRYALVLMDCQMPELDGFAATSEIRQLERRGGARLPIVAMTANAMAGDRDECLTAGMDDYLPKPVTMEGLRAVLERWLPVAAPIGTSSTTS